MGVSRIRQEEVHTRGAGIDDSLDPLDHDALAADLADTIDFLASQIRRITRKPRWEDPPDAPGFPVLLGWGAGLVGTTVTPKFLFPWYGDRSAEVRESAIVVPRAGVVRNLVVRQTVPDGNGADLRYVVRVDGVDTGLVVALSSTAELGSNSTEQVAVSAGGRLSVRVTKVSPIGASPRNVTATAEFV